MAPIFAEATGLGARRYPADNRRIRDVWAWNFSAEFDDLLAVVANGGRDVIIALDIEFPGCVWEDPLHAAQVVRYSALQENVDILQPIQIGLAVAGGEEGTTFQGVWNFNLWFDLTLSLYTEESVRFLEAAGLDFPRHAVEGIDPLEMAWRLASSALVGKHAGSPRWVTFSGWHDWGYLLKLLTCGSPMPPDLGSFNDQLAAHCPRRHELRDRLPRGSLDSLIAANGIERVGAAHTAGSDALATLELYLLEDSQEVPPEAKVLRPRAAPGGRAASLRARAPAGGKLPSTTTSRLSAKAPPFVASAPWPTNGYVSRGPGAAAAVFEPGAFCWTTTLGSIKLDAGMKDHVAVEQGIVCGRSDASASSSSSETPTPPPAAESEDSPSDEADRAEPEPGGDERCGGAEPGDAESGGEEEAEALSEAAQSAGDSADAEPSICAPLAACRRRGSAPVQSPCAARSWADRNFEECAQKVRALEVRLLVVGLAQLSVVVFSCCYLLF